MAPSSHPPVDSRGRREGGGAFAFLHPVFLTKCNANVSHPRSHRRGLRWGKLISRVLAKGMKLCPRCFFEQAIDCFTFLPIRNPAYPTLCSCSAPILLRRKPQLFLMTLKGLEKASLAVEGCTNYFGLHKRREGKSAAIMRSW